MHCRSGGESVEKSTEHRRYVKSDSIYTSLRFNGCGWLIKSFTGAIDSGRDQEVVCSQATGLDAGTVKRSGERWDYKRGWRMR
jgi:hypothetical protein